MPRLVTPNPRLPARPTNSDLLVSRARDHVQLGRKALQSGDKEAARIEFDQAMVLMWQASETAVDREDFQRRFETLVDAIHRLDVNGLDAGAVSEPGEVKPPLEDILELTFPVDPSLKNRVREELRSSSSQLPLMVNDSVLGFLKYFSGRGHNTIVAGLRRAGKYRPMIQRILAEEGVPQELIHLAQAESGFLPRAVSRMRAVGMWQFVADTGRLYGLNRSLSHDDRMDPEKATRAAARHLRDLYERYGDWYLAIAAYNCGAGNVDRAIERTGHADFWILRERRTLPLETTNYVPIILAMTIMAKNPVDYDIDDIATEDPLDYETIELSAPTHLGLIADLTDSSVAELQEMNPALLKNVAPAGFSLHAPRSADLAAKLDVIPANYRASWRVHRVSAGDSLAGIARQFGLAAPAIASANRIAAGDSLPAEGEYLLIPRAYASETSQSNAKLANRLAPSGKRAAAKPTTRPAAARSRKPAAKKPVIAVTRGRRG